MSLISWILSFFSAKQDIINVPKISVRFKWNGTKEMDKKTDYILDRLIFTNESTAGELRKNTELICYTLEDTCRRQKIPHRTAIPSGTYQIVVNWSEKFDKELPLLLKVPNFEGIRIHAGNTATDTSGCILVGMKKGENAVYDSKKALSNLMNFLIPSLKDGVVFLTVFGGNDHVS